MKAATLFSLNLDFLIFACRLLIEQIVVPLQEKLEDWKKVVINLDKEHAKGKIYDTCLVVVAMKIYFIFCYVYVV